MNRGNVRAIATYPTQSGRRRIFPYTGCGEQFSETRGTVFFDLRTVEETLILVLKLRLCKVESTALSFALGVTEGTVLEWLHRAAEKADEINQHWLARSERHAGSTGRVVELHRAQARHHSNPGRCKPRRERGWTPRGVGQLRARVSPAARRLCRPPHLEKRLALDSEDGRCRLWYALFLQ
jgi:hypothetical protein